MRATLPIAAIFASVGLVTGAAAQQSAPLRELGLNGDIPAGCIMAAPTAPSAQNATATALASGTADVVITRLVGDDGAPLGAQMTLNLPSACNQSHTLSISSLNGGMTNPDAGAPGAAFRTVLPYQVVVTWAGQTRTFDSAASAATVAVGDAARGDLSVTIQISPGGAPLVAGSYSDQLVLELGVAG